MEMTHEEIVRMFKFAKDKNEQIKILADLNVTTTDEITRILAEEGAIEGVTKKMHGGKLVGKRGNGYGKWTEERLTLLQEYIDKGLTYEQIGEIMGEKKKAIISAVSNYSLRGRGHKAVNPSVSCADSPLNVAESTEVIPSGKEKDEVCVYVAEPVKKECEEKRKLKLECLVEDLECGMKRIRDLCVCIDGIDEEYFNCAQEVTRVLNDGIMGALSDMERWIKAWRD